MVRIGHSINRTIKRSLSNVPIKKVNGIRNKLLEYWKGNTCNNVEHEKGAQLLSRTEIFTKVEPQTVKINIQSQKRITEVTWLSILRCTIKLMVFDFDIMYLKGNTILYVDALSRLKFGDEQLENYENVWRQIIIQGRNECFAPKSTQKRNKTGLRFKEDTRENKEKYMEQLINGREILQRHELTIEKSIIFNGNTILPQQWRILRHIGNTKKVKVACLVAGIFESYRRLYQKRLKMFWNNFLN